MWRARLLALHLVVVHAGIAPVPVSAQSSTAEPQSAPPAASGRSSPIQVTAGADLVVTSAYVWRGFVPTDRASVQPMLWVKLGDLTVSSWFNVAGEQPNGALTEHDFTVDWSKARGAWTFSGGWIHYVFPGVSTGGVSSEFYGGVAYAGLLNPTVRVFQDVQEGRGTYVNVGIGHTLALPRGVALTPTVTLGYNHQQWTSESGWSDANVTLRLLVPMPQPHVFLAPFVAYSKSLETGLFPRKLYGGVSLTVK